MMQKRLISALLALSLLLTPVTALADEEEPDLTIRGGGDITSTEKPTLKVEGSDSESGYQWKRNGEAIDGATGSSITADRSGDYTVSYDSDDSSKSNSVRIVRDFETRGSSSVLIGRRSNNLAKRKDSQIEKLEARVNQAVADAAKPLPAVSLGMIYTAVDTAASAGGVATLYDAGLLESDQREILMRRIGEAGLPDRLYADRIADRKVVTRLSLVPSRISPPVDLGLSLGDEALTAMLEEAFTNRLLVVDAAQEGSYGQTVEMIVQGDALAGAGNLSFYRYDAASNRCGPIAVSKVFFDQKGYLHFSVASGGVFVISEGDLSGR